MNRWANFARTGNPHVSSSAIIETSSTEEWIPVSGHTVDSDAAAAADPRHIHFSSIGGTMAESDSDKIEQCVVIETAVKNSSPQ
jgi:hypothetical protein